MSEKNKNMMLFQNQNLGCNLDFEEVKAELLKLFKSPNPLYIYLNSKDIKDKFSQILSCLTLRIKDGFKINSDNEKTFIMTIYKQSNYDKIWLELIENYLRDVKNFDLLNYIYFVKILNKDKQYLAKGLLKMYNKTSEDEIRDFLARYNSKIKFEEIKNIFLKFNIGEMTFDINLREDFVEHFIEKIYLQLEHNLKSLFLDNFILKIDKYKSDFNDVSKIVLKIISSYIQKDKYLQVLKTISGEYFKDVKLYVDDLINNYGTIRGTFYFQMYEILLVLNNTDRGLFWKYIKKQMIDKYYPEIKNLFYDYSSTIFLDKDTYSNLSGEIKVVESISPESEYILGEYKEINDLKEIILELNDNLFSFFLLPIIYYTVSEQLALKKKDLYKIKYLLLFIFSKNYSEYKKIYMFFNQLEVFLNFEKNTRVFDKIKVSFSIILFVFLSLLISYHYFPIGVFIGILTLSTIKSVEVIYPHVFYKLKWNVGLKFFAIVFLCVSSYYWFANFDKVKGDTANITKQIQFLGTISSKEVIDEGIKYIKVNLLEFNK